MKFEGHCKFEEKSFLASRKVEWSLHHSRKESKKGWRNAPSKGGKYNSIYGLNWQALIIIYLYKPNEYEQRSAKARKSTVQVY